MNAKDKAKLEKIISDLRVIHSDMETQYDEMESEVQDGEKGETLYASKDSVEEAISSLESAIE